MKFTLSWLKDHLDTDADLASIVEKLSMIGLEVEGVDDRAEALSPFTVAYVKRAEPHPDADRLHVCHVDTADGEVQVVCGAPNARSGMWAVFAPAGSWIPGTASRLKAGVIRGVASNGMLVSEREVGLSDEHEGIIDLAPDGDAEGLVVGRPFAEVIRYDDPVIEIAITPNRGDCLGVRGIARDLAAAGLGSLKPLYAPRIEGSFDSPKEWRRDLPADRQDACSYVCGRYFRGVRNGPSPRWMQDRLRAIGLRPISALVDVTNYVTFDLGRPLHVFDADKVAGHPTMRFARSGESLTALDGRDYELDSQTLVIADDNGPEAIAGIMGGERSGCTEATTNVFLEVALFDPIMVAESGRRLGIHSDARYRFERGVDPESARWGAEVAARFIQEICGGEVSRVVEAGELPSARRTVALRVGRVSAIGGVDVPAEEQGRVLRALGFEVERQGDLLECVVPSWRSDVESEACLVEEVLRLHGFEHIPVTPLELDTALPLPALNPNQRRVYAARTALCWGGLDEAVTFSFISERQARLFGWSDERLRLDNPISSDLDVMRPSLLPTLIQAAARNSDRGYGDVGLFEVGPQYSDPTVDGQATVAAAVRSGRTGPRHWAAAPRSVDAFDAKADALRVLEAAGAPVGGLQVTADAPGWYHPGRSGALRLGPKVLAWFGELHPRVLAAFDLKGPAVGCEVFLDAVPMPKARPGSLKPALKLSPFQPVERDFAFLVDEDVPAEKAIRAAKSVDKQLITKIDLFDVYRGPGVPDGQKSLALAVTLQPQDKTLTDEEIEAVSQRIVAQVGKATGGRLRG